MDINDIKLTLYAASNEISGTRKEVLAARKVFADAATRLAAIPTKYAATIAAVQALGNAPHEAAYKSELQAIAAAFTALQTIASAASTWLQANTTGLEG